MYEYESQQIRHAQLVEEADRARLVRQARQAAKQSAGGAERGFGGWRRGQGRVGAARSLRSHFTRAA